VIGLMTGISAEREYVRDGKLTKMIIVELTDQDIFYLRLLLNVQAGCTSYEDLKTVHGRVYDSFREACVALKLLEDDLEFINAIKEVSELGSGISLRKMFAKLLMSNSMSNPLHVWNEVSEILVDGILYQKRRILNNPG
jgi:hypothetical protein